MKKKEIILIWVGTVALIMWGINRYVLVPSFRQAPAPSQMEYQVVAIMIFGAVASLMYFGYLLVMVYNKNRDVK